jgi:hypothetical protein
MSLEETITIMEQAAPQRIIPQRALKIVLSKHLNQSR